MNVLIALSFSCIFFSASKDNFLLKDLTSRLRSNSIVKFLTVWHERMTYDVCYSQYFHCISCIGIGYVNQIGNIHSFDWKIVNKRRAHPIHISCWGTRFQKSVTGTQIVHLKCLFKWIFEWMFDPAITITLKKGKVRIYLLLKYLLLKRWQYD